MSNRVKALNAILDILIELYNNGQATYEYICNRAKEEAFDRNISFENYAIKYLKNNIMEVLENE